MGHYLGLDTHDTASIGHDRPLQPDTVITIEPGLYIPNSPQFGQLAGLGVRLEDDVLVLPEGCEVMSHAAPVAAAGLEALVSSGLRPGGQHSRQPGCARDDAPGEELAMSGRA